MNKIFIKSLLVLNMALYMALAQSPEQFSFNPTQYSSVILGQAFLDGERAEQGDWIGAFDEEGNCAGQPRG